MKNIWMIIIVNKLCRSLIDSQIARMTVQFGYSRSGCFTET